MAGVQFDFLNVDLDKFENPEDPMDGQNPNYTDMPKTLEELKAIIKE
jgi:hypothetical protein